ncbi:MAG TPA: helix-turn-helix domain-containing protein [Nitrososphaera sp.]|nr:helix-turn-helix domain-containing protein [Nitrososphaera sp.]
MVRQKRGDAKLRETAQAIGIGPATLLRVESGRIPDVTTFGKICKWLNVDPGSFLGFDPNEFLQPPEVPQEPTPLQVSAHLKVDQTPKRETVNAIATMIFLAAKTQRATEEINGDGIDA